MKISKLTPRNVEKIRQAMKDGKPIKVDVKEVEFDSGEEDLAFAYGFALVQAEMEKTAAARAKQAASAKKRAKGAARARELVLEAVEKSIKQDIADGKVAALNAPLLTLEYIAQKIGGRVTKRVWSKYFREKFEIDRKIN